MDVAAWLRDLGLEAYAEAFAENGVDAELLGDLNNEDLKDLGVAKLADRKRLLNAIANLASDSPARDARPSQPATATGEHRQVTVLFADIAGFTRLTTELGAENIHSLLNRYFETVDAIVANYGGTVDKHMGDNVMAVFGAPIAHDDDPLRAVRAAFEIHRQVGQLHDSTRPQAAGSCRHCQRPGGGQRHRQRQASGIYRHRRFGESCCKAPISGQSW